VVEKLKNGGKWDGQGRGRMVLSMVWGIGRLGVVLGRVGLGYSWIAGQLDSWALLGDNLINRKRTVGRGEMMSRRAAANEQ